MDTHDAKVRIFSEVSKKYLAIVHSEYAAVVDFTALAGGKQLYVAPASEKIISQGDTVSEFEDRAVGILSPLRYESGQRPITTRLSFC